MENPNKNNSSNPNPSNLKLIFKISAFVLLLLFFIYKVEKPSYGSNRGTNNYQSQETIDAKNNNKKIYPTTEITDSTYNEYKKILQETDESSNRHNITTQSTKSTNELYEKIHIAFEGEPEIEKIKPLLEAVMVNYKLPITYENIEEVGDCLVYLRQHSKVGVTEMDILKHIYQKGTNNLNLKNDEDFKRQAAFSFSQLEFSN